MPEHVFLTPLHYWSEFNRITAELAHRADLLHVETGVAFATAIRGNAPYPNMVHQLRNQLADVLRLLEQAEPALRAAATLGCGLDTPSWEASGDGD